MLLPESFLLNRKLDTLVENKSTFCTDNAQINVYETHQNADKVILKFDDFVLASMIEGKKVMHLQDFDSFDFFPGESLILPRERVMCIDFPEATLDNPTRCLAMTISEDSISQVMGLMNESFDRSDGEWVNSEIGYHFTNDAVVYRILQRFLFLFAENNPLKDIFLDNMLKELLVRIFQLNSREKHISSYKKNSTNSQIAASIEHIMNNLHINLKVEDLANVACMSTPNYYRVFKNEMGMPPLSFIMQQRIRKAESMLKNPNNRIKDIFYHCGFENQSYFNRVFKKFKKLSPKEYQKQANVIVYS